jgi:hypothetical protein
MKRIVIIYFVIEVIIQATHFSLQWMCGDDWLVSALKGTLKAGGQAAFAALSILEALKQIIFLSIIALACIKFGANRLRRNELLDQSAK